MINIINDGMKDNIQSLYFMLMVILECCLMFLLRTAILFYQNGFDLYYFSFLSKL